MNRTNLLCVLMAVAGAGCRGEADAQLDPNVALDDDALQPLTGDLFVNGDFETGALSAWSSTAATIAGGAPAHGGAFAARLSGGQAHVSQGLQRRLKADTLYTFTAYVRVEAAGGSWGSPWLRLSRFRDLGSSDFGDARALDSVAAGWQQLTVKHSFTAAELSGPVFAGVRSFGSEGTALVDDVSGRTAPSACTPTPCAAQGKDCGSLSDGCGGALDCGSCAAPLTCGGGGIANLCGQPTCVLTTCAAQGKDCGSISDGCGGTLDCGSCASALTCGGGGIANRCGQPTCAPATCGAQGKNCGSMPDGCGGTLACGSCTSPLTCGGGGTANVCGQPSATFAGTLMFVQRATNSNGSLYLPSSNDMAGVGVHSRLRPASPGKLLVRDGQGALRALVDGASPAAASLNLVDVSGFDISYDATRVVFAGLPNGNYDRSPEQNPGAWRIYAMNVDGSGLKQLTLSNQSLNLAQFGNAAGGLAAYDDFDPAWLPDGRIVFSSTRWPSYAQYAGARTSNLYTMNADGTGLRRITSERNGADRAMVDPLTGKIVFARWWRNFRFPLNSMATVTGYVDGNSNWPGYVALDGLSADRNVQMDGTGAYADFVFRNDWHVAAINPDGTGLQRLITNFEERGGGNGDWYGGAFSADGQTLFANFFPMFKTSEASGFGGIRRFSRSSIGGGVGILGVTDLSGAYVHPTDPVSYGVYQGSYASEPAVLPDGRLVVSWAADTRQDYGLYLVNADGTGRTALYDNAGTQELRARVLATRPLPPIIPDAITQVPSVLPPAAQGPYDIDGTFTFNALNVYANGPVDGPDILNAPAVGSAAKIRFFIDHQRQSPGSYATIDWPISLGEAAVSPSGAVVVTDAPANVPLFEQLRSADGTVPFTSGPYEKRASAAQVAGMNYGRPGANARCMGCHLGHTMIPVPAGDVDAQFSNLAPGATVTVSSSADPNTNRGLIDRQVQKGEIWRYWRSAPGQATNQWVTLTFAVPVTVKAVRLYNPRQGGEALSTLQVGAAKVTLCADAACTTPAATATTGPLAVAGTNISFANVLARAVRVDVQSMSGTFYGASVASLAEVEVIGRGEAGP